MKRTLTLKKESLAELTPDELGSVVGGTVVTRTCTPIVSYVPCAVVGSVLQSCMTC